MLESSWAFAVELPGLIVGGDSRDDMADPPKRSARSDPQSGCYNEPKDTPPEMSVIELARSWQDKAQNRCVAGACHRSQYTPDFAVARNLNARTWRKASYEQREGLPRKSGKHALVESYPSLTTSAIFPFLPRYKAPKIIEQTLQQPISRFNSVHTSARSASGW